MIPVACRQGPQSRSVVECEEQRTREKWMSINPTLQTKHVPSKLSFRRRLSDVSLLCSISPSAKVIISLMQNVMQGIFVQCKAGRHRNGVAS